jgi:Fe-S-cluster containining protein
MVFNMNYNLEKSSPDRISLYGTVYSLTGNMTPMLFDCGKLCGVRCCKGDKGMLLFPFEEDYLDRFNHDFTITCSNLIVNSRPVRLLSCNGTCDRNIRPLACRLFPIFPFVHESGSIELGFDPRARGICPLLFTDMEDLYIRGIFRLKALKAARLLSKDGHILAFMKMMTVELETYGKFM